MLTETETVPERVSNDDLQRAWRPSLKPEHRGEPAPPGSVIINQPRRGLFTLLLGYLTRPAVKVIVVVSLFIVAAIVFEATVNGGSWTERPAKRQATRHR